MADEKMDKQPAAPTLPLPPMSVEKKQQQQPRPPFFDVKLVNLWAFFHAVLYLAFGFVVYYYTLVVTTNPPSARKFAECVLSWLLRPPAAATTDDTADLACSVLLMAMLSCSVPQAAAGALALLLPRRRWRLRRAASRAALALTVANHCMYAAVAVLILGRGDQPVGLFFELLVYGSIFTCGVLDLLSYLALRSSVENGEQIDQFSKQADASSAERD